MNEAKREHLNSRQLYSGLIRLHILHHAAREGIFGLGMIEELARHGYKLSPGTLYPVLHGLEQDGLLRSEKHNLSGKIRRVYRTTPAGLRVLKAAKEKVWELFGELFEKVPVIEIARTRPRVVSVRAANFRKSSAANVSL
jgi:DNA-binding PadR family transcriptional regulator